MNDKQKSPFPMKVSLAENTYTLDLVTASSSILKLTVCEPGYDDNSITFPEALLIRYARELLLRAKTHRAEMEVAEMFGFEAPWWPYVGLALAGDTKKEDNG